MVRSASIWCADDCQFSITAAGMMMMMTTTTMSSERLHPFFSCNA